MTPRAHLVVAIAALGIAVLIVWLVNRRQLRSKYGLLWLAIAVLLLPIGLFPGLAENLSDLVGIQYAPTAFLMVAVGLLFAIVVHYSWELSRMEDRIRQLAEELALLRFTVTRQETAEHDGS